MCQPLPHLQTDPRPTSLLFNLPETLFYECHCTCKTFTVCSLKSNLLHLSSMAFSLHFISQCPANSCAGPEAGLAKVSLHCHCALVFEFFQKLNCLHSKYSLSVPTLTGSACTTISLWAGGRHSLTGKRFVGGEEI